MTSEHKKNWKCLQCLSKTPKSDNKNNNVYNQSSLFVNKISRKAKIKPVLNEEEWDAKNMGGGPTITDLLIEIKAIKQQNMQLLPLKEEVTILKGIILNLEKSVEQLRSAITERDKKSSKNIPNSQELLHNANPGTFSSVMTQKTGRQILTVQAATSKIAAVSGKNQYPIASTPSVSEVRPARRRRVLEQPGDLLGEDKLQPSTSTQLLVENFTHEEKPEKWTVIQKKIRPKRQIVVGAGVVDEQLKTTVRLKHLQAWSFAPDTTVEAVRSYLLKTASNENITVIKRDIKTDRHASFVVGVPEILYALFNSPTAWPPGVRVSEWFLARPREHQRGQPTKTT